MRSISREIQSEHADSSFSSLYFLHINVVGASTEAVPLLAGAKTQQNASSRPGGVFEHALFAWLLKDTGRQHGAPRRGPASFPQTARGGACAS